MHKNRERPESSSKSKGGKLRLAMYQDLHPATDDPQYVEKMRALYPGIDCPELIVDLGYQAIYPAVWVRDSGKLTDSELESLKEEMEARKHPLPQREA